MGQLSIQAFQEAQLKRVGFDSSCGQVPRTICTNKTNTWQTAALITLTTIKGKSMQINLMIIKMFIGHLSTMIPKQFSGHNWRG